MEVKFIKPTEEDISFIAKNMRESDVKEVWSSDHHTPHEALTSSLERSHVASVVTVNDEPCVMMGLGVHGILSGTGSPWMLGTESSTKHARLFLTQTSSVIQEMLDICPYLFNYVHVENEISIRWLKRIGFVFDEPKPYGKECEMFHKFHIARV